jgi:pyruvate dehydrogenase E1 component beta subunit
LSIKTTAAALNEAISDALEQDPSVIVMGEDVAAFGGVFRVTAGLLDRFGADRVLDTPISELGFTSVAVGAAMAGARPVVEVMFCDFLLYAMDALVNQAAYLPLMSGGQLRVPMVVRAAAGAGRANAAQHSQSLQVLFAHIPGLTVVMPSEPYEAKGLLASAIASDDPVIFLEDKIGYYVKQEVPDEPYRIPLGQVRCDRFGPPDATDVDVTVVATGSQAALARAAAIQLAEEEISVEVVDVRTVSPLDRDGIAAAVARSGRLVVVDQGYRSFGVGAEIAASVVESCWGQLLAPPVRIGTVDGPIPFNPDLERAFMPGDRVLDACRRLVHGS